MYVEQHTGSATGDYYQHACIWTFLLLFLDFFFTLDSGDNADNEDHKDNWDNGDRDDHHEDSEDSG